MISLALEKSQYLELLTCSSPPPQNLYDSIRNEPFKIPEDDGNDLTHTFFNPDREGWLLKLGTSLPEPAGHFAGDTSGPGQD